jgi:hypothetical protein
MVHRSDGTEFAHSDALRLWASVAYEKLKDVAHVYNDTISYKDLALHVQDATGVETNQLIMNWIGPVLEIAAQRAADAEEPPLTSLCIHADGSIGDGYKRAPKFAPESATSDVEDIAEKHRLLCYQRYATDLPEGGGRPTPTPQIAIRRRSSPVSDDDTVWLDEVIARGNLSVNDRIPFNTHVQVAKLFGRNDNGHQGATISLDKFTGVWFPKMYPNGDWDNSLSADGDMITMRHIPGGKSGAVMESTRLRDYVITFGNVKPQSGSRYYEFLGVFEGEPSLSDNTRWVHRRVAETIYFDGSGDFAFESTIVRPFHDDQAAEAADVDIKEVATLQKRFNSGDYFVEDQTGATRLRGSAQRVFAKAVKENYGWECAVTGISTPAFLVASHIVPWSADKNIRIDPSNGLCLSTFVDRAFDTGFLEIRPNGRTFVRWDKVKGDLILKIELSKIDDIEIAKPASNPPDPAKLAMRIQLEY